jgi:hypothetical protein
MQEEQHERSSNVREVARQEKQCEKSGNMKGVVVQKNQQREKQLREE